MKPAAVLPSDLAEYAALDAIERGREDVLPRLALSVAEAAKAIGVPEGTLRDAIRLRELAIVNVGHGTVRRRIVIRLEDLREYLARRRVPSRHEATP